VKKYEFFEHTADIGLKIYGKTLTELFINAAEGMFEAIADTGTVAAQHTIEISISEQAENDAELLRLWLQELLYYYSTTEIVFVEFLIHTLTLNNLKATVKGDKAFGKIKTEIKAVTYHQLEVKRSKDGYEATVIFDV